MNKKQLIVAWAMVLIFLSGCVSVNYTSYKENLKLPPKPKDVEIPIVEGDISSGYETIGLLSITRSMEYGSWLLPSRAQAREALAKSNIEEIKKKARMIGADACCEIQHIESESSVEHGSSGGRDISSSEDKTATVTTTITYTTPVLYLSTEAKALIKKQKE